MTTNTFKRRLSRLLESTDCFATDVIDMKKIRGNVKKHGFDDVLYVAGEDDNEVFLLHIQKI